MVGGQGQEISEAFVADGRREDEFEAVVVGLDRGPAVGDVGPSCRRAVLG